MCCPWSREGTYGFRLLYCSRTEAILRREIGKEGERLMRWRCRRGLVVAGKTLKIPSSCDLNLGKIYPGLAQGKGAKIEDAGDRMVLCSFKKFWFFKHRQRCWCTGSRNLHNCTSIPFVPEINLSRTRRWQWTSMVRNLRPESTEAKSSSVIRYSRDSYHYDLPSSTASSARMECERDPSPAWHGSSASRISPAC